jgi:hypothetical protein
MSSDFWNGTMFEFTLRAGEEITPLGEQSVARIESAAGLKRE